MTTLTMDGGRKIESPIIIQRTTKGDAANGLEPRHLTYILKVIQEPERARACGSGAKSSADRRPVDPPPVVQLQIFEGEGHGPLRKPDEGPELRKDITFAYSANFFLFATLESARPIAHGRGQPPPSQPPVLTGMPVSGMAYLDRPQEAGYFIFPDLSVRHEGKYRLSFNLYEQTKDACDVDAETGNDDKKQMGTEEADASFAWRMEVKSKSFMVFSAKKFTGLHESTGLSRTVAEQGCRVRIRRDVRMRRRDTKPNDFEDGEGENDYSRGQQTPSDYQKRQRSRSSSSEGGGFPSLSPTREPQMPPGGALAFGQSSQAPSFQPPPVAPPSAYQQHQNPSHGYQRVPHYAPHVPAPGPSYSYGRESGPSYPQTAHPSESSRVRDYEPEPRRASYPAHMAASSQHVPLQVDTSPYESRRESRGYEARHGYAARPVSPIVSPGASTVLPPIQSLESKFHIQPRQAAYEQKIEKYDPSSPPEPRSSMRPIAPDSPVYERAPAGYQYGPHSAQSPESKPRSGKRTYAETFPPMQDAPLFNGQRPTIAHYTGEEMSAAERDMRYKRSDGRFEIRHLPDPMDSSSQLL